MGASNLPLAVAVFIAVVSVPLILGLVPPNPLYGFRTPSTLANEVLWYRVNHFAGWALLVAATASSAVMAGVRAGALPAIFPDAAVLAIPALVAVVASFVYLRIVTRAIGTADQSAASASSGGLTRRNSRHSRKS